MKGRGRALAALAATIAMVTSCEPPSGTPLSPTEEHYGRTYGAWGAEWWRFVSEFAPITNHPLLDRTGENCLAGQNDNRSVLFLFGSLGPTVTRHCTVSSSQALFFPLVNALFDNSGLPMSDYQTSEQWRLMAEERNRVIGALVLEVDGRRYSDAELRTYIVAPEHLSYTVPPAPNLYSEVWATPWEGPVADSWTAGAWVMLAPLPVGSHTIHFGGSVLDASGAPVFTVDITYDLTVQ